MRPGSRDPFHETKPYLLTIWSSARARRPSPWRRALSFSAVARFYQGGESSPAAPKHPHTDLIPASRHHRPVRHSVGGAAVMTRGRGARRGCPSRSTERGEEINARRGVCV